MDKNEMYLVEFNTGVYIKTIYIIEGDEYSNKTFFLLEMLSDINLNNLIDIKTLIKNQVFKYFRRIEGFCEDDYEEDLNIILKEIKEILDYKKER